MIWWEENRNSVKSILKNIKYMNEDERAMMVEELEEVIKELREEPDEEIVSDTYAVTDRTGLAIKSWSYNG